MDILTHTISGIAIGTGAVSFVDKGLIGKIKIILLSGFAAAMPDIDAMSLWSKFDKTIGKFFHLEHTGKEIYSSKFWYSHHAFMHSIAAALLIVFVIMIVLKIFDKESSIKSFFQQNKVLMASMFCAFLIHLFEDMPTPSSSWGGVNLFWPSSQYIGGYGQIWWWNNYDIFLIVLLTIFLNAIILSFSFLLKNKTKWFTIAILLLGFTFSMKQIHSRNFDFNYTQSSGKYQECEKESLEIQKQILGEKLFGIMNEFDKKMKIYF